MFGEEGYERELRALAESLGIAERVEFRGFREDVWPELASMDVLVHASVIPEPFGTVVLEGMAAGLAVIAADEGGPASVIADGETGRLFRSRDLDSLAAAMRALRRDPAERGASAPPLSARSRTTTRARWPAGWSASTIGSWRRADTPIAVSGCQGSRRERR